MTVCEALMKIGGCNNEERKDDEGEVLFEEVERELLEVLGIGENDDDTDDEYLSEDLEDDEEDFEDMEDDEELIAEGEDELLDLLKDGRIDRTLEDYVEDRVNLFSVSELEDLKKGEGVKRAQPQRILSMQDQTLEDIRNDIKHLPKVHHGGESQTVAPPLEHTVQ